MEDHWTPINLWTCLFASTVSFPAVGTSPSGWGDLLQFLFILGFDESTVESEELFYRPAQKNVSMDICFHVFEGIKLRGVELKSVF